MPLPDALTLPINRKSVNHAGSIPVNKNVDLTKETTSTPGSFFAQEFRLRMRERFKSDLQFYDFLPIQEVEELVNNVFQLEEKDRPTVQPEEIQLNSREQTADKMTDSLLEHIIFSTDRHTLSLSKEQLLHAIKDFYGEEK